MKLEIHISHRHRLAFEQIIDFYLSRLNDQLRLLEINVEERPDEYDKPRFLIDLSAERNDGSSIQLQEDQAKLSTAVHRTFDRLVRRLSRPQIYQETRPPMARLN